MAESSPKFKVKNDALRKAIRAICQLVSRRSANSNALFEDATETVNCLFTLSKIPDKRRMRPVMIPLPNPMYDEKSEICFICKDPQKKYKELLLQKHPVPGITKVIGVDKLRKKYASPEARRALADAFDLFLCDFNVAEMMPQLLGSIFYKKKKKIPIPAKLFCSDPKPFLEKAIRGTPMRIPAGTCLGVKIGKCSMPEEDLVANATAVIKGVLKNVSDNPIQYICVQATETPALPVWRRPPPPGSLLNLRRDSSGASSSAASDTGTSRASDTEGTDYGELPSDAGETLSTRDTVSEPETQDEMSFAEDIHLDAGDVDEDSAQDKTAMPLIQGLKGKKRGRAGGGQEKVPTKSQKVSAQGSPNKTPAEAAPRVPPGSKKAVGTMLPPATTKAKKNMGKA